MKISIFYYYPIYILIRLWQSTRLLRSIIGFNSCRFYPSCSDYLLDALKVHGLIQGPFLWIKRITKCHPFCEGGIDEIKKSWSSYGS